MTPNNIRGDTELWRFPPFTLTAEEKREVVATVMQMAVLAMFRTHVYFFGGHTYKQSTGGSIGLRSTCAVARITMSHWDAKWANATCHMRKQSDIWTMDVWHCFH